MEKLNLHQSVKWAATVLTVLISTAGHAQMDCRSNLGAHLTPFHKNVPILWAIEGTIAPGIMSSPYNTTDYTILNGGMVLAALDFTVAKKNNFYLEGGYKNWKTSEDDDESIHSASRNWGMRQVFYGFTDKSIKIKAGLHETQLGSFPIVDERMLGISADYAYGAFNVNLRAGTVMKNFARMGVFCSNRHLYGIISPNYTENIGKKLGDTNLGGIALNWNPQYKKTVETPSNSDEFAEFSDEANNAFDSNNSLEFSNIQLLFYNEFGSNHFIPDNKLYIGAFADMNLPWTLTLKAGGFYQNMTNNNTLVYVAKLGKLVSWQNGASTVFDLGYIGKADITANALYQPIFSNLFLGEIMRLDAPDFPLWMAEATHRFHGKLKLHISVKTVAQIQDAHTNEQDLELGIFTFKSHLQLTLIGSRVHANLTPEDFYMIRTELRLAF